MVARLSTRDIWASDFKIGLQCHVQMVHLEHLVQMEVGSMSSTALVHDAEVLERSLKSTGDQIELSLSRETVEMISDVVKARANGQEVIVTQGFEEVTPSEAAVLLGMSRPHVRRLMDRGAIPFRLVGTHHRIRVADVRAFDRAERQRQEEAMSEFSQLQNDFGLLE